ncbi:MULTISPECIES: Gfo/Idh/MocA family oxidoreductase [unclassified Leptolyngbya]|uniref:Gfo/Idh/MocA family protein n=1 Tax=unclassified Leptolyngbya TaxID=2650499 RepID=UPI001685C84B|nr:MULTISPECIES: Gfo/Idh/MocA family oxidoreductase [unclassified Leptolyngbya]MBD1909974.1 Gfo/Idh/MocA family oxidoreductase [Leptolyngbya sp. FACHB-8]MBD2156822.1 Gfo/Idh/MocA family oxidoreductase [Leptolyngbya sp. FACHB-16]
MVHASESDRSPSEPRKIRYAVVGLGWIAQEDVLPAFEQTENSELVALVSGDPVKLAELVQRQGGVQRVFSYEEYDDCLSSGLVDAVYIALPNHLHCDFTVRAAQQGIHVLCEKPMAVTEAECEQMIRAAQDNHVKLMIAYRLHFDPANMEAVRVAQSGDLGELRIFQSILSQQVEEENVRLEPIDNGGGTVYDMGIYCINAARYLFQEDPTEVIALSSNHNNDSRFRESDEMTSVVLRFPGDRLATFTSSFGVTPTSNFQIIGTKGSLRLDPSYTYQGEIQQTLTINGEKQEQSIPVGDQFAAEIAYFSDCILQDKEPEPSGLEGLIDVAIISAITRSAQMEGHPIKLPAFPRKQRPGPDQIIRYPAKQGSTPLVHAADPSGKS